jgi:hypothetical protein
MLRDNLVGLIEPIRISAGVDPLALSIQQQASDDRSSCLENPRPNGAESSLTETSPLHFRLSQHRRTSAFFAKRFRSVGASHRASPQHLSVAVRISHERGDFCSCLAVDFVRKTVYLRQASLCTWLESYTVTAVLLLRAIINIYRPTKACSSPTRT